MNSITITDKQFAELKEALGSYLKVIALNGVKELSKTQEGRNVWLLNSAGFNQPQIAGILDIDQSAVSRILTGKAGKKKGKGKTVEE